MDLLQQGKLFEFARRDKCEILYLPSGLVRVTTKDLAAGKVDGKFKGPCTIYTLEPLHNGLLNIVIVPYLFTKPTDIVIIPLTIEMKKHPKPTVAHIAVVEDVNNPREDRGEWVSKVKVRRIAANSNDPIVALVAGKQLPCAIGFSENGVALKFKENSYTLE